MPDDSTRPKTSSGSIYDGRSPAGQFALARLRSILRDSGFVVEKERPTEGTLRVYPERRGRYPLLNPRFVPPGRGSGILMATPTVVFDVYSDHDESITAVLKGLPVAGEWSFKLAPRRLNRGRYRLHGRLVLPLSFIGDRRNQDIDFEALRNPLGALHVELTDGLFGGGDSNFRSDIS